jgi:beta-phosphoglucomutase
MIQAIFFDFNGVISNDERIHLKAYRQVLESEGVTISDEEYFACLGMDDLAFVRAAFARRDQPLTGDQMNAVIEREHQLHRELIAEELPVSQNTVSFVREAARRYELGVVSMAVRAEIDHVLKLIGLENSFSVYVTGGQVEKHKPAPDCYLRALELLNEKRRADRKLPVLASECLVFEDAPPGIEAARAAGMRTIGLTNTVSETDLRAAGADIVTSNLGDWTVASIHHLFD